MVNIAVLISGGGTNLQALIDNIDRGNIDGEIKLIISNKKEAYGLVRGQNAGIESIYIDPLDLSAEEYDQKIMEELEKRNIELVVLAGYLKILSKEFIQKYNKRIINIHPSLLPKFGGKGYYGDRVHKAVLESGEKITGATVHFVDEGTDTGEIILQETVEVKENDTVESLKARVLEVEHKLLPEAVRLIQLTMDM